MLPSHPRDTCSVRSNFKETYLGLVGAVVLGLVGAVVCGVSWCSSIGVNWCSSIGVSWCMSQQTPRVYY